MITCKCDPPIIFAANHDGMSSKGVFYWFVLFAVCFVAYQQIIDHIRPAYIGTHQTFIYFMGVAPNFFPAIGIPALFVIILPHLDKNNNRWLIEKKHISAVSISLAGLISWEFFQLTSPNLRFDWHDVLWTLIGTAVFWLIWVVSPARFKESTETSPSGQINPEQ